MRVTENQGVRLARRAGKAAAPQHREIDHFIAHETGRGSGHAEPGRQRFEGGQLVVDSLQDVRDAFGVAHQQMPPAAMSERDIQQLTYYTLSLRRKDLPDAYLPKDRIQAVKFGALLERGEYRYDAHDHHAGDQDGRDQHRLETTQAERRHRGRLDRVAHFAPASASSTAERLTISPLTLAKRFIRPRMCK